MLQIKQINQLTTALNNKVEQSQITTDVLLGISNTLVPSQNAVKQYVDNAIALVDNGSGSGSVTEYPFITGESILTIVHGSNRLFGSEDLMITVAKADTNTSGYLSYIDWNIFNEKQNSLVANIDYVTPSELSTSYYNKTELQTSGNASIHWNNITNVPSLGLSYTFDNGLTESTGGYITFGGNLIENTSIELAEKTFSISNTISGYAIGTGFNQGVLGSDIQVDNKIVCVGYFTSYNGTYANHIARLNTDGTIDNSFNSGTGFNAIPSKVFIQPDGKIIVVGGFTSYNGTVMNGIVRLNSNGSIDTGFNSGGAGIDTGGVLCASIHSSGKIAIIGSFNTYNGISRKNIAVLNSNGTLDNSFVVGTGLNSYGEAIKFQSDGKVLIISSATSYNGTSINGIFRANSNGSIDSSFNVGTGLDYGYNAIISILSTGKIMIGGYFTSYNGNARNRILRLNADGSIDSGFNIGTGLDAYPTAIKEQSDGKVIVTGSFFGYRSINSQRLVRINPDGSIDSSFITGNMLDSTSWSCNIQSDGKIIVAGQFLSFNSISIHGIIRLNADGSLNNIFTNSKTMTSTFNKGLLVHDENYSAYYTNRTLIDKEYVDTQIPNISYTKVQLQTSGQSAIHWGNITNIPSLGTTYTFDNGLTEITGNVVELGGIISYDVIFDDSRSVPHGLQYASNYSLTFDNRSLIDKEYVDTQISNIPKSIGITLTKGSIVSYLSGIKIYIESDEILTIPQYYDYNTYSLNIDGIVDCVGTINYM